MSFLHWNDLSTKLKRRSHQRHQFAAEAVEEAKAADAAGTSTATAVFRCDFRHNGSTQEHASAGGFRADADHHRGFISTASLMMDFDI